MGRNFCFFVFFLVVSAFSFAESKAYTTLLGSNEIAVIDLETNSVETYIDLGVSPNYIAISPDNLTAYVTSSDPASIYIIDLLSNTVVDSILVGTPDVSSTAGIAITPDGTTAYVANTGDNQVVPVNLLTNVVGTPIDGGKFSSPRNLVITPVAVTEDGLKAYVTNPGDSSVTPIFLSTNTPQDPIDIGVFPADIAIASNGQKVFISDGFTSTIASIDLTTDATSSFPITSPGTIFVTVAPNSVNGYTSTLQDAGVGLVVPFSVSAEMQGTAISFPGTDIFGLVVSSDSATLYACGLQLDSVYPVDLSVVPAVVGSAITLTTSPYRIVLASPPPILEGTASVAFNQTLFFTQKNYYNTLTWTDPNQRIATSFRIYRNADLTDLATTVSASAEKIFVDQNLKAHTTYSYYIVSVYPNGDTLLIANTNITTP